MNLDQLASDKKLSEAEFHSLFGPLVGHKDFKPKLWHSGSIHRTTYYTLAYPKGFRDMVRMAKQNLSRPVGVAYENIVTCLNELRNSKEIVGVGENIVTEILATAVTADNKKQVEMVTVQAKAGYATGYGDPDYIAQLPVFHTPQLSKD